MNITKIKKWAAIAAIAVGSPLVSQAITLTLGGPLPGFRIASLGSADVGYAGTGNATAATVLGYTGGNAWTERADVAGNGGPGTYANGGLTIVVTSGSWGGSGPLSGTWSINNAATFWATYGDAAISLHTGGGGGSPDHFVWVLTDFATSGAWSYDGSTLSGGGLSNLKLFSRNAPNPDRGNTVPDGGATVALLGLAMCGLGVIRSRLIKA